MSDRPRPIPRHGLPLGQLYVFKKFAPVRLDRMAPNFDQFCHGSPFFLSYLFTEALHDIAKDIRFVAL